MTKFYAANAKGSQYLRETWPTLSNPLCVYGRGPNRDGFSARFVSCCGHHAAFTKLEVELLPSAEECL